MGDILELNTVEDSPVFASITMMVCSGIPYCLLSTSSLIKRKKKELKNWGALVKLNPLQASPKGCILMDGLPPLGFVCFVNSCPW